ncbi:hypothetical protein Q4553_02220 [Tenacibaculum soleae]|uniref:hypothetical protein n=1 Tax=Tenacibaculum soleae TaxID=447689 RepID=UPI0026E41A94|nr:hypothetical protein [Tenacibaculum soleae]MDO6743381.1 hypothetical protein [Tenacibaculum soleae]
MKKIILLLMISFLVFQSCAVRKRNTRVHKVMTIKKAPKNHKVVVIKNKRYYTWGGKHYKNTKRGFIVAHL